MPKRTLHVLVLAVLAVSCRTSPNDTASTDRSPTLTAASAPGRATSGAMPAPPPQGKVSFTDAEIEDTVRHELMRDPAVGAAGVTTTVKDGIVTLTGTVDHLLAKERAVQLAEIVKGVRAVADHLAVARTSLPDAALAEGVRSALHESPVVDAFGLDVSAKDGVVTIRGQVPSIPQKLMAERVVRATRGVKDVKDEVDIRFAGDRPDTDIQRDVRSRLRWDALVDDAQVSAVVDKGVVHLRGVVGSAAEKTRAQWDAWVAGVKDVDARELAVRFWARTPELRGDKYPVLPDRDVQSAVSEVLRNDPRTSTDPITPSVSGGVVTLRGSVASLAAKNAAEQLAKDVVGVSGVADRLDVKSGLQRPDDELERRVLSMLALDPYTDRFRIEPKVKDGKVTLTGTVGTAFDRAEAEGVAANVRGIRAIDDRLAVTNPMASFAPDPYVSPFYVPLADTAKTPPHATQPDAALGRQLATDLAWSPFLDSADVNVETKDGVVRLTGTVGTPRERDVATAAALEAGAAAVDNRLTVKPR